MSGERKNSSSQSIGALLQNLSQLCRSDCLSEKGLREIIGLHGFAPKNNDANIKSYKFFRSACHNERVTEGILRYLLKYFPHAVRAVGEGGQLSIHIVCYNNKNVTRGMVQLLIDAFPDSVRHETNKGSMPLHRLCRNQNLDDGIGLGILKLLLKRCPEAVRHTARDGDLPIHFAAAFQSSEFCRVLIEANPGSERIADNDGVLPFHAACQCNTVATVKYLYELYPESINVANNGGNYPIHYAIMGLKNRSNLKEGIKVVKFLLEYNPDVLGEHTPLHFACCSDVTLNAVQLLIDAFPDSLLHENNKGGLPLHVLCCNKILTEEVKVDVLKLLLRRCPESVRHTNRTGNLPIHIAAINQSPEFCRILIEAYLGSERMTNDDGILPFHMACGGNAVATVKYLYELYPESIDVTGIDEVCPIHHAIIRLKNRSNPATAVEMIQFLLHCDPNVALHKLLDKLPLYWVCIEATNNEEYMLNAHLKIMQILYDVHPEAIESNEVTSSVGEFCAEVQTFINANLTYARQARDQTVMTTPDEDGQLPLHRALRDSATISLGSMKLLIKGNLSAICTFDNRGMIPLHVACQHHEIPVIVEYLIGLNKFTLTTVDREGNTVLHYACRGEKHAIIALLLDKFGSVSVSKRNAQGQLPIDLLLRNKDEKSVKFTESIYRLIRANPETLMHYDLGQTSAEDCQNRKKRKIDEV